MNLLIEFTRHAPDIDGKPGEWSDWVPQFVRAPGYVDPDEGEPFSSQPYRSPTFWHQRELREYVPK